MKIDINLTSIVTRIRNRNDVFIGTIKNWLKFPINELVIVDWRDDGCERVWDVITQINDPRIKVIETKYEYRFIVGAAQNLGIASAVNPYILCLDVDYVLNDCFFDSIECDETHFTHRHTNDARAGLLCFTKNMWETVNGFDENIVHWGCEDQDFSQRLQNQGYTQIPWVDGIFEHIPHELSRSIDSQVQLANPHEAPGIRMLFVKMYEELVQRNPWTHKQKRVNWDVKQLQHNRYLAIRKFQ